MASESGGAGVVCRSLLPCPSPSDRSSRLRRSDHVSDQRPSRTSPVRAPSAEVPARDRSSCRGPLPARSYGRRRSPSRPAAAPRRGPSAVAPRRSVVAASTVVRRTGPITAARSIALGVPTPPLIPGVALVAPAPRLGVAAVLPAGPTPAVVVAPTALVLDASALAATVVPADVAFARAVGGAIVAAWTAVGAIAAAAVISTVVATPVAAPVVAPAAAFAAGAVVAPTAATIITTGTVIPPATAAVVAARTFVPPAAATAVVPTVAATPAGAPVVAPAAAFTAGAIVTRATTTAAAIRPTGVATPAAAASVVTPRRALAPAAATAAGAVVVRRPCNRRSPPRSSRQPPPLRLGPLSREPPPPRSSRQPPPLRLGPLSREPPRSSRRGAPSRQLPPLRLGPLSREPPRSSRRGAPSRQPLPSRRGPSFRQPLPAPRSSRRGRSSLALPPARSSRRGRSSRQPLPSRGRSLPVRGPRRSPSRFHVPRGAIGTAVVATAAPRAAAVVATAGRSVAAVGSRSATRVVVAIAPRRPLRTPTALPSAAGPAPAFAATATGIASIRVAGAAGPIAPASITALACPVVITCRRTVSVATAVMPTRVFATGPIRHTHYTRIQTSERGPRAPDNGHPPADAKMGERQMPLPHYFGFDVGGVLLSHTLSSAVPSALEGLASGFGMGPGVPPPPKPPTTLFTLFTLLSHPPITDNDGDGGGGGVLRVTQWMRVTSFLRRLVAGRVGYG